MDFYKFLEEEPEWDAESIIRGLQTVLPMIDQLRTHHTGPTDFPRFAAATDILNQAISWIKYHEAWRQYMANFEGDP